MKTFKINSVDDWHEHGAGELLQYPVTGRGRKIRVEFNTTHQTEVWMNRDVEDGKGETQTERVLVGAAQGQFDVQISVHADTELLILYPEAGAVFYRDHGPSHVVKPLSDEQFTTIEPRGARNTEQQRMLLLMKLNQDRMRAQLQNEMLQREQKMEARIQQRAEKLAASEALIETKKEENEDEASPAGDTTPNSED